jgi:hypothetical protein
LDGCAKGAAAEVLETMVEIKNGVEASDVDPEIQVTAYYIQANYEGLYRQHSGLFNRVLSPALGISVMGKDHECAIFKNFVCLCSHDLFFF